METVDIATATTEPGEPDSSCDSSTLSVWYAFTPQETGSITATLSGGSYAGMGVYTGSSLGNLSEVNCRYYYGPVTFRADAGQTYYFQVGERFANGGQVQFDLNPAPAPEPGFGFHPADPSSYDTVQFWYWSSDPGGADILSQEWRFGDGETSTEYFGVHRYAVDGDYPVQLTITTRDGRTASASRIVQVRTHDVAIVRFSAPQSASVSQTRQISVGVRNTRDPETVTVELLRSGPGGFQHVGELTQSVPVRPSNQTVPFNFSYTFTADEAAVGKVTFKAVANIQGTHDALPGDNEAIASPTRVNT
jgi:PKD repeat protein